MRKKNNTNKPRWLVISYYANVDGRAASHHIDDRLLAFRAAGIDVTVLSSTLGPRYQDQQKHIRVCSMLPSAVLDELKASVKNNQYCSLPVQVLRLVLQVLVAIPIALMSIVERMLLHRDKRWSWQFTAALRGWLRFRKQPPDLILSTGGASSAHEAGRWIANKLDVPLVCEFQDPLPFQYPPSDMPTHEYHLKLETKLAGTAKALIYLTEGAVEAAKVRLSDHTRGKTLAKCFAITSGAPAVMAPAKVYGKRRVLAHIGTLSGTRNLDVLLQALAELATDDAQLHERFTIRLAGTLDKSVLQSIDAFKLKNQIEVLGRQPREALDAVIANADILLLIQNTGPIAKETIPSKAFEYLQSGRPIFGLIDGNKQLNSILQDHGHAVYDYGDEICVLKQTLRTYLYEPLPEIKVCRLTVQHSVDKLISAVTSVL